MIGEIIFILMVVVILAPTIDVLIKNKKLV